MRVLMITHDDLDGVGCPVVAYQAFGGGLEVHHVTNKEADSVIRTKLDLYLRGVIMDPTSKPEDRYDLILITDLSVKPHVAELINQLHLLEQNIVLIDHHVTSDYMRNYRWAIVEYDHIPVSGMKPGKTSGTSLLVEYLLQQDYLEVDEDILLFAEKVRRYDTWEWKDIYDDQTSGDLSMLLGLLGRDEFKERFYNSPTPYLTDGEQALLTFEARRRDRYIDRKMKQVKKGHVHWHNVAYVYAEDCHSELGHRICDENRDIDFVIIIDTAREALSFRTVKDIDLSKIAAHYGGGGHPRASGAPIHSDLFKGFFLDALQLK